MNDILELLRLSVQQHLDGTLPTSGCVTCRRHMLAAADEIKRLRARNEQLERIAMGRM